MFENKEEQLAFNESIDTSGWVRDSLGIHTAGWGLTLFPLWIWQKSVSYI